MYGEPINYSKQEVMKSTIFSDMEINLEHIFIRNTQNMKIDKYKNNP